MTRESCDPVAIEPGAVDDIAGRELAGPRLDDDFAGSLGESGDACTNVHLDAARVRNLRVFRRDQGIIGDAGCRNLERAQAADVRLNLAHRRSLKHIEAGESIGLAARAQIVEA